MTYDRDKMVAEGIGYRCLSYSAGGHAKPGQVGDILSFEQMAGNEYVLKEIIEALGLSIVLKDIVDEDWWEVGSAIKEKYGNARAMWMTTEEAAQSIYCHEDETPVPIQISQCAIPTVDLGPEGVLFVYPEGCGEIGRD